MSEFKPINTQEEFDIAIKDRISRERKKFEGYLSPEQVEELKKASSNSEELEALKNTNASLKGRIKDFERKELISKVLNDNGLPTSASEFLKGETEEELNNSAVSLKSLFPKEKEEEPEYRAPAPTTPTPKNNKGSVVDGVEKRFMELNPTLKI